MRKLRPFFGFLAAVGATLLAGQAVRGWASGAPQAPPLPRERARLPAAVPEPELVRKVAEALEPIEQGRWVALDLRPVEAYGAGHLPGARPWPRPRQATAIGLEELRRELGGLGLTGHEPVLVYAAAGEASLLGRAFWWLEWAGVGRVAVLDGTIEDWERAGGRLETETPQGSPRAFAEPGRAAAVANLSDLRESYGLSGFELLDLRDRGVWMKAGYRTPPRWGAGHVPYALPYDLLPWMESGWPSVEACWSELEKLGPRHDAFVDLRAEFLLYGDGPEDPQLGLAYLLLRRMGVRARVVSEGFRAWAAEAGNPAVRIFEPAEVAELLLASAGEPVSRRPLVVDLREARDFAEGHIPAAVNLPWFELPQTFEQALARERPGFSREHLPLIFYCYGRECIRSREAGNLAARSGFLRIGWLREGLGGWPEARLPLEFSLEIAGRVLDAEGEPVTGARVVYRPAGSASGDRASVASREAASGKEGRFALGGLPPGRGRLSVSAAGFRAFELEGVEVTIPGEQKELEIVLAIGAVLSGQVRHADGQPAARATVQVLTAADSSTAGRLGAAIADRQGRYQIDSLPLEPVAVEASLPGVGRTVERIELAGRAATLDLTLPAGVSVSGWVVDSDAQPVAGARLVLSGERGETAAGRSVSAGNGSFSFARVGAGEYALAAFKDGYFQDPTAARLQVAEAEIRDVMVRLAPGLAVSGRLLGLAAEDLARARVLAHGLPDARSGEVEPAGTYRLDGLAPGDWRIKALVPGTGRQAEALLTLDASQPETQLDLDLSQGHSLTGHVQHRGEPLAGALVVVFSAALGLANHTVTAGDGSFELANLAPSLYQLKVSAAGRGLSHSEELALEGDREVWLDLSGSTLAGRVLSAADSRPLAGAMLRLERRGEAEAFSQGELPRLATADSLGGFQFEELPEGDFRLTASAPGHAARVEELAIAPGIETGALELALTPSQGLSLTVRTAAGEAPGQVTAAVLGPDGQIVLHGSFVLDPEGRLELSSVPDGTWQLLLAAGSSATLSLVVEAPTDLGTVVLPRGGGLYLTVGDLAGGGTAAGGTLVGNDGRPLLLLDAAGRISPHFLLERGRARLASIPAGSWTVEVAAADGRRWRLPALIVAGGEAEVSAP